MKDKLLNVWIDLTGKIYDVELIDHITFACNYFDKINEYPRNPADELVDIGWVKISTWLHVPPFILSNKCNNRQIRSIVNLYTEYNLPVPADYKPEQ